MSKDERDLVQRLRKLEKINDVLMERLQRIGEMRGPAWVQTRTAAVLEREVIRRNRDLEEALQRLARINAELAQANNIADEANRAKSRFLRAASHDLLQPLSAAKLFLSHLQAGSDDPEQSDLIATVTATLDSAEELIAALSNMAKLDSHKFEMNRTPLGMDRLFRRIAIDTQSLAAARGIDLRFVQTSAWVESDPVFLRQIVQNLVINALKYTTGAKVLVGLRRRQGLIWLEVHDLGPGIAPEDQDRIFQEFERLSCTHPPGTGLGLSIVRRACDQLTHPLELISRVGVGSCFRVGLPLHDSQDRARPDVPFAAASRPAYGGKRALVIENDEAMRRAVALLLGGWEFSVEAVASGAEALRVIEDQPPDLILSDYRLEDGETGVEVLAVLQEVLPQPMAAIILSAEDSAMIAREAGDLASSVLRKPFSEEALRAAIDHALTQGLRAG